MSKQGDFLIYCIERYRINKGLTGNEVIEIFKKYDVLNYIVNFYESLHTTGDNYIINDIDLFINSRQTI